MSESIRGRWCFHVNECAGAEVYGGLVIITAKTSLLALNITVSSTHQFDIRTCVSCAVVGDGNLAEPPGGDFVAGDGAAWYLLFSREPRVHGISHFVNSRPGFPNPAR